MSTSPSMYQTPQTPGQEQVEDYQNVSSFLQGVDFNKAKPNALKGIPSTNAELDYIYTDLTPNNGLHGGRSWNDELCYGAGTTYLAGLSLGGVWGFREGLAQTKDVTSRKLRVNGILNACTRRGPFLANSAGVLALLYFSADGIFGKIRGKRDASTSILAAVGAGMLFRSTAGFRAARIAGTIGGSLALVWHAGKYILNRSEE
ncbi:Tim17/Tim22/Tim23/Pmp24 family-domain-containing protein [Piptocephalis cylindrospora]|uniref:Tim17/Tim22/Tim23/Pmp24 family-domain-containing protein n=1 Tax=Piptocephalis cylindrospora TaxID=1907219 RepID=A0A4P9Y8W3_9FUNG|nr:Tim17/Tim22/Tim23/Pmp24 family-domain-containing protein [Piptocephalis cylindrospora]|eukprot:RKP14430.1 Tim17/Tim22/Tim23/Pmp24 family-domain-containing protein [Piptocephalis cylindrospora]